MRARKATRLGAYDYRTTGGYFVTVCTWRKRPLLSTLRGDTASLTTIGELTRQCWFEIPGRVKSVTTDVVAIMPDHVHGILFLREAAASLSTVVQLFKQAVTRRVRARGASMPHPLWQRGFYEHVVRDEADLYRLRLYVAHNAVRHTST